MKPICQMGTRSVSFHVEMCTTPGSWCSRKRMSFGILAAWITPICLNQCLLLVKW